METTIMDKFTVGQFFTKEFLEKKVFPEGFTIDKTFKEKLLIPNKDKIININEDISKLEECSLPGAMNGDDAQKYAESTPMSEEELLLIINLLICDYHADETQRCLHILGTKYYPEVSYQFHVKLVSGELLRVFLSKFGPFYLSAHEFNSGVAGGLLCHLK